MDTYKLSSVADVGPLVAKATSIDSGRTGASGVPSPCERHPRRQMSFVVGLSYGQ